MDISTQELVARNMKQLRNVYGYTQAEVADQLHICRTTYTLYELGRKFPSMEMLVDLAALYDIRIDVILDSRTPFYITQVFSEDRCKQDLKVLVESYYRLPPHAQGKLVERAEVLLEAEGLLVPI